MYWLLVLLCLASLSVTVSSGGLCGPTCVACNKIRSILEMTSCPNCPCLKDMVRGEIEQKCDYVDPSIYCPNGYDVDEKGCKISRCKELEHCPPNPLKGCGKDCALGYMTDIKGCPMCECQCDTDGMNDDQSLKFCEKQCPGQSFTIEPDFTGCSVCTCSKEGRISPTCNGRDTAIHCRGNCSRWGFKGGCGPRPCDCRCPRTGLRCENHECPGNLPARLLIDKVGCEIRCICDKPERIVANVCVKQVDCPAQCGELGFEYEHDGHGCVTACRCKCGESKCKHECKFGSKTDAFRCSTCECLPPKPSPQFHLPPCPIDTFRCNFSCGFYDYKEKSVPGTRGCRRNCACGCPPVKCREDCLVDTQIRVDRFGCQECVCDDHTCGCKPEKKKKCGSYGHKIGLDGCESCECNCPKTPPCPTDCTEGKTIIVQDDYGCSSCQCAEDW